MDKHIDRQRILSILFFIGIMIINWFYIFVIGQQSMIITRLIVVIPFIITLCVGLGLIGLYALYYYNFWGFIAIYFMIIGSSVFALVVNQSIEYVVVVEPYPLSALLLINCVVLCYVIYFQINTGKKS